MKFSLLAIASFVSMAAVVAPVQGHDACGDTVIDIAGQAYWVIEAADATAHWGYLESNGVPELQRGGVMVHGNPDWCQTTPNPDLGFY